MKKNKKDGFTLAEVLIALSIVGVVAIIMIGSLGKIKPNQEKAMFRKAYYTVERVVSELLNDEELYPDSTDLTDTSEVTYREETYSGKLKFCELFQAKVNVAEVGEECSYMNGITRIIADTSAKVWGPNFTTTDGVLFSIPGASLLSADSNGNGYYAIIVDVNGENEPNCLDLPDDVSGSSLMIYSTQASCDSKRKDRFVIQVYPNGRVTVFDGSKAQEYLSDVSAN